MAQVVGVAVGDPADQFFDVVAIVFEFLGNLIQQFRVGGLVLLVEIVDGVCEASTKKH